MERHFGGFIWDVRNRKVYADAKHSQAEERLFCLGKVAGRIMTVRFTYREGLIRIIGAGYWR